MAKKWGVGASLLALLPVFILAPLEAYRQQFALPIPQSALYDSKTSLPVLSETRILGLVKELSEDIGFRTVGTQEHARGDAWMLERAEEVKSWCEEVVKSGNRKLSCEVWRQQGSGSHRFDIMNTRLYKSYVNLTNIVVRVSDGTPEGKENALLINSHLDSTLPSPGAADDAVSVCVMLECLRVLVHDPTWQPKHALVFLFNNAEESLQDGSHLYSLQHPTAKTIRAAMNLEAAGTRGREILFQATSKEMIDAYSHVPRPFGTIFANDIFSTNLLQSDTDFRQFQQYLNVTGLDMAIIGNGYLYHMQKDIVENIQPGVAQNMAGNALALMYFLSSSSSNLPSLAPPAGQPNVTPPKPSTVYYSHLGRFWKYSFATATYLHGGLLCAVLSTVLVSQIPMAQLLWGAVANILGLVGAIAGSQIVATVIANDKFLDKGMSWFSREYLALGLYGPASLLGATLFQLPLLSNEGQKGRTSESAVLLSLLVIMSTLAFVVQLLGIGSSAIFLLNAAPLLVSFLGNKLFVRLASTVCGSTETKPKKSKGKGKIKAAPHPESTYLSLITYCTGQSFPLLTGMLMWFPCSQVFIPLMGRIGHALPPDTIVAMIVPVIGTLCLPLTASFLHRFTRREILPSLITLAAITNLLIAVYSRMSPFDDMHQKRMFISYVDNITSSTQELHLAAADSGPGFEILVGKIADSFDEKHTLTTEYNGLVQTLPVPYVVGGSASIQREIMTSSNPDWDSLYPFSLALKPFKMPLLVPSDLEYKSPYRDTFKVIAVEDVKNAEQSTRKLRLKIEHPGLIWTVIAFEAHVLSWDLDDNPPNELTRHHIKEASFYGEDAWHVDLVVNTTLSQTLTVNFIGLQENGMWPGKKSVKEQGGPSMVLFEALDRWLDATSQGTIDATLVGAVAGIVTL